MRPVEYYAIKLNLPDIKFRYSVEITQNFRSKPTGLAERDYLQKQIVCPDAVERRVEGKNHERDKSRGVAAHFNPVVELSTSLVIS